MSDSPSPPDVYARNLLSNRGYPLWTPEPCVELPDCYRREGLKIGDVGVVVPEDGSFDVFFNITLPAEHPLHAHDGVPNNFTQVQLTREDYRVVPDAEFPGRVISSSSVGCTVSCIYPFDLNGNARSLTDHQFNFCKNEGAMLILPEGAERHRLAKELLLLDVIIQNAIEWYRFSREQLYRNISNDALYLVTGFHKASSWSLASFCNSEASSARCKLVQSTNGGPILASHSTWETVRPLDWRIGPRHTFGFPNQSVFITGFKIAINEELLHLKRVTVRADHSKRMLASRLVGFGSGLANFFVGETSARGTQPLGSVAQRDSEAAEHQSLADGREHVTVERIPRVSQPFHPSDVINRYLLIEEPSAVIAVTHDSQWITLLERGILKREDLMQERCLEQVVSREYHIATKDGVVYLESTVPEPEVSSVTYKSDSIPNPSSNVPMAASRYPSKATFETCNASESTQTHTSSSFGTSFDSPHICNRPRANDLELNQAPEPLPYLPTDFTQLSAPLPLPSLRSEPRAPYFSLSHMHTQQNRPTSKRHHPSDDFNDIQGEQPGVPEQEAVRPRPIGSCARCRNLKVRCEFRNDSNTCRRCTSASQECVIHRRKLRLAPPKREHLLDQIREQAKQIQGLMAEVEALNRAAQSRVATVHSPIESNSQSVVLSTEIQDQVSIAHISTEKSGGFGSEAVKKYLDDEPGFTKDEKIMGLPAGSVVKVEQTQAIQLKMLPEDEVLYDLMATLAIQKDAQEKSVKLESSEVVGVANADSFRLDLGPDPRCLNLSTTGVWLPHILARGIVSIKEVDELFNIYFEKMNPLASLLDPALHTPQYVAMRSPFLFTMICGVASRFYECRPRLYQQLMQFGRYAAGSALTSGTKNEEMSAAYLLMQLYPVPAKRWDEERSWIYLGVAIRIAQDINLNRQITAKPLDAQNARILLSRQRIWMICFNLDHAAWIQYGKRPTITDTDYFVLNSADWWRSSPYNMKGFDIHICGYNAGLRVISNFVGKIYGDPTHPIGLDKTLNIAQLASDTDDALRELGEHWSKHLDQFEEEKTKLWAFRTELVGMAYTVSRLIALSAGLKHAKGGKFDENAFIMRCLEAASDVVDIFVHRLFPTSERKILLRHAPDSQCVLVVSAGAFLVKLLQPKYSQYFPYERQQEIRTLVQEAADLLGASEVVMDDEDRPKLFSRFLSDLLANQSVNSNTFSPKPPKNIHLRHVSSRSKAAFDKGNEPSRSFPSLHSDGASALSDSVQFLSESLW